MAQSPGTYITAQVEDFEILPGVPDAIRLLNERSYKAEEFETTTHDYIAPNLLEVARWIIDRNKESFQ